MHITLLQCNGLERNEKFFEKNCQKKNFVKKKEIFEKKQIWTNIFFWKFSEVPRFRYFPKVM